MIIFVRKNDNDANIFAKDVKREMSQLKLLPILLISHYPDSGSKSVGFGFQEVLTNYDILVASVLLAILKPMPFRM